MKNGIPKKLISLFCIICVMFSSLPINSVFAEVAPFETERTIKSDLAKSPKDLLNQPLMPPTTNKFTYEKAKRNSERRTAANPSTEEKTAQLEIFKPIIETAITEEKRELILESKISMSDNFSKIQDLVICSNYILIPKNSQFASGIGFTEKENPEENIWEISFTINYSTMYGLPTNLPFFYYLEDNQESMDRFNKLYESGTRKVLLFVKYRSFIPENGFSYWQPFTKKLNRKLYESGSNEFYYNSINNLYYDTQVSLSKSSLGEVVDKYYLVSSTLSKSSATRGFFKVDNNATLESHLRNVVKKRTSYINLAYTSSANFDLEKIQDILIDEAKNLSETEGVKLKINAIYPAFTYYPIVTEGVYLELGYYSSESPDYTYFTNINDMNKYIRYAFLENSRAKYNVSVPLTWSTPRYDVDWSIDNFFGALSRSFDDSLTTFSNVVTNNNLAQFTVCNQYSKKDEKTLENARKIISENITPYMSPEEKLAIIHDYIAKNTDYDFVSLNDFDYGMTFPKDYTIYTPYGVLVKKAAVCDGYAKAFWLMCNLAGVPVNYLYGGNHAWNSVKLNNNEYFIDVTWDSNGNLSYDRNYYMLSRQQFNLNHRPAVDLTKLNNFASDINGTPDTFEKACRLDLLGICENDTDLYSFSTKPSNLDAAVMLVKLLGKEKDALNSNYKHPFKDVPDWANKYIAFLYEKKYLADNNDGFFRPQAAVSFDDFSTYLLYAEGYNANSTKKISIDTDKKLLSLGIVTTESELARLKNSFTATDMVNITYKTLFIKRPAFNNTLIEKLYLQTKSISFDDLIASGIVLPKQELNTSSSNLFKGLLQ